MFYSKYLSGLLRSISTVNKARELGVAFTRHEKFDNMFKRELAIREGLVNRRYLLFDSFDYVVDIDYRVACFYAKYFNKIMKLYHKGFSFKEAHKLLKSMCKEATKDYIVDDIVSISSGVEEGSLYVAVCSYDIDMSFTIDDENDFVKHSVSLLSLLGAVEENTDAQVKWFSSYLVKELDKINRGVKAEPYVNRRKSVCYFRDYVDSLKDDASSEKGELTVFYKKEA